MQMMQQTHQMDQYQMQMQSHQMQDQQFMWQPQPNQMYNGVGSDNGKQNSSHIYLRHIN